MSVDCLFSPAALVVAAVFLAGGAAAKTGPTYWTPERVQQLREHAKKDDAELQRCLRGSNVQFCGMQYFPAETLVELSDEQLWGLMPSTTIKRALDPNEVKGCPVHGQEVRRFHSYYPWRFDCINRPYKVQCPVGGEWYPSNDYAAGDMTSGDYADDGSGCRIEGDAYQFIQHYAYGAYLTCVKPGISALAGAYAHTGEAKYAHACAVLLARVAAEYPNATDKRERCYRGAYGHISGMIADHVWATDILVKLCQAYDRIYEFLPQDPELMRFLSGKLGGVSDAAGFRDCIEERILRSGGQAVMDQAMLGNTGMSQLTLATVALILDDVSDKRPNSRDMMYWLYHGSGGLLWVGNQLYKDGSSYESMSYNGARRCFIWALERAELLQALRPDAFPLRDYPKLTDHPKFRALTTFHDRAGCLGRYRPAVGDAAGSMKTPTTPPRRRHGDRQRSDLLDGFGLALLRQGAGDATQRALWLFYGGLLGHRHDDPLNLGLMAYGYDLLPEFAYPAHFRWAWSWEASLPSHNTVVVDGVTQVGRLIRGRANCFLEAPGFGFVDAEHNPYPYDRTHRPDLPAVSEYRRTCALVAVSEAGFYVFDLFRVTGGVQHQLCWHGPDTEGDMTYDGPALTAQKGGSVAGPDVERGAYYRDASGRLRHDAFGWMRNVRRGAVVEPVTLDWAVKDAADTHLSLRLLPGGGDELALASGVPPGQETGYTAEFAILAKGKPRPADPWISGDGAEIVIGAEDFEGFDCRDDYFWETKGWTPIPRGEYINGASARAFKPGKTITCGRYEIPAGDYRLFLGVFNYNSGENRVRVEVNGVTCEVGWGSLPLAYEDCMAHWTEGVILRNVPAGSSLSLTTLQVEQPAASVDTIYLTTDLLRDAPTSAHPLLSRIDRAAEQLKSRFLTVIEPYQGRPSIASVMRLESGDGCVGASVELAGGRQDVLLASDAAGGAVAAQGVSVAGELGMVRRRGDRVEAARLVKGTMLRCGDCLLETPAAVETLRITAVDRVANAVTVSPAPAAPRLLVGRWVRTGNEFRSGMYRVTAVAAAEDGATIGFDETASLSEGRAAGFRTGRIRNGFVPAPFAGTRRRADGALDFSNAWFRGCWLSDANNRCQWQVAGVLVNQAYGHCLHAAGHFDVALREQVDANALARALSPSNRFVLWDYGVGDSLEIAHSVHLRSTGEGAWRLTTSGPVTVRIPQAGARVRLRATGAAEWTDSPSSIALAGAGLTGAEWEIEAVR